MQRWGLRRTNRAVVVEGGSHIVAAALVTRRCPDRWHATVVLDEPDAAPVVAAAIDDSPAWSVVGATAHVAPLLAHLRRRPLAVGTVQFHGTSPPTTQRSDLDPRVRLATATDLEPLVQLYSTFEQQDIPTRPRLRRFLRAAIDAVPIMVADVDGRVVGAMRLDGRGGYPGGNGARSAMSWRYCMSRRGRLKPRAPTMRPSRP